MSLEDETDHASEASWQTLLEPRAIPAPPPPPSRLTRIAMRAIPMGCGGLIVLGIAIVTGIVGWRAYRNIETPLDATGVHARAVSHVENSLRDGLRDLSRAGTVCGYQVSRVRYVQVDHVELVGGNQGYGTAQVTLVGDSVLTGYDQPLLNGIAGVPCRASYRFNYVVTRTPRANNEWYEQTNLSEMQLYRPLAVGSALTGTLLLGDAQLSDGALMDDYGIPMRAGHPVTIVVRGRTDQWPSVDVMAGLFDEAGTQVALDDDSAGGYNARLVFTPTADGTYYLRVTHALQGVQQGGYSVVTLDGAHPEAY